MKQTMKKLLLTFSLFFCFLISGIGQVSFGGGIAYLDSEIGVQARANIDASSFDLIPKFTYYFVSNATVMSFDLDAAFNLATLGDDIPIYGFVGPTLYRASVGPFSNSEIGLNVGVGTNISSIYIEVRYTRLFCDGCGGDVGFAAGYMF